MGRNCETPHEGGGSAELFITKGGGLLSYFACMGVGVGPVYLSYLGASYAHSQRVVAMSTKCYRAI